MRAEEGLSQGFALHITALSTDATIPLKSLVGQPLLLELLTAGAAGRRPFHGYITTAELSGANGGFARYQLVAEPWTAFLGHTRDSRIFQDMTVFDILDAVFVRYQGQGRLTPAWRFDLRERALYARRSHTTQYQESDLAFVERLMLDEGLFHFFEHSGDPASPSLGSHELVIADHNGCVQAQRARDRPVHPARRRHEGRQHRPLAQRIEAPDHRRRNCQLGLPHARNLRPALAAANGVSPFTLLSRDTPGAYA